MDREKMVEEIIKRFCEYHKMDGGCYCNGKRCKDWNCYTRQSAEQIVNKYIPDGAVVLTREECDSKVILDEDHFLRALDKEREKVRKETAREYHDKVTKIIHERDYVEGYAEIGLNEENDEILKEYGVEVEECTNHLM